MERRDTFLRDAHGYADVRPEYPGELLEEAVSLAQLEAGDSLIEIGCGPGQATRWFAERGYVIRAFDRGPDMVRAARERLAAFPNVEVRLADFEEVAPTGSRDAVLAATSYHWLDPDTRARRCAAHLRPGGSLLLLWHTHPPPFAGFFERVQAIYARHAPEWQPPPAPGMTEQRIREVCAELARSGAFGAVERRSLDWSRTYPRARYERLLATYSDHVMLGAERCRALIADIGALIDDEFGGRVTRPYRTELVVARRGRAAQ